MASKDQINLHVKCIWEQIRSNHLERIWFHIKGIVRAVKGI